MRLKSVVNGVALLAVVLVILVFLLTTIAVMPDMRRRSQVAEIILAFGQAKQEIMNRVAAKKTLAGAGAGLVIKPFKNVTGGEVSVDGIIVARGTVDGYPVEAVDIPALDEGGKLTWRCGVIKDFEGFSKLDKLVLPNRKFLYFPAQCRYQATATSIDAP